MTSEPDARAQDRLSTEQAWLSLMQTEEGRSLALACYYDGDILGACGRFEKSEEWQAVRSIIRRRCPPESDVLDLGAGNGIASYALARSGYKVTAVEPDPSHLVGYGALRTMVRKTSLPIKHVFAYGEALPLGNNKYSMVYVRQVLHHARDLSRMLAETSRVLKPGGMLIACREHIIDDQQSLALFLSRHPIHQYTYGENAFALTVYLEAIESAGMTIKTVLGPWDSVINHYPVSNREVREQIQNALRQRRGRLGELCGRLPAIEAFYRGRRSIAEKAPGRLYTLVAVSRR
jgi:SAM-dependent methyltransferase